MCQSAIVIFFSKKPRDAFWQDRCHATAIETGEHLLGCLAYIDLNMVRVSAHGKWVQAALEEIDAKRESRWTEGITVGGRPFIERIKKAVGAMAKGRCLQPGEGASELRQAQ